MAIDFTGVTPTDDDGTGTTGTVANAAWVAALKSAIDTYIGDWTAVAYAAGNFSATGGGTWTVDSGDQTTFRYRKIGKTLTIQLAIDTTSIAGTVSRVNITVPGSFVSATTLRQPITIYNNGTAETGVCTVVASGTTLLIDRPASANFTASTNQTYVNGMIVIETTT